MSAASDLVISAIIHVQVSAPYVNMIMLTLDRYSSPYASPEHVPR
jgi:hypothetical protein